MPARPPSLEYQHSLQNLSRPRKAQSVYARCSSAKAKSIEDDFFPQTPFPNPKGHRVYRIGNFKRPSCSLLDFCRGTVGKVVPHIATGSPVKLRALGTPKRKKAQFTSLVVENKPLRRIEGHEEHRHTVLTSPANAGRKRVRW
jgi:hypothetical protein